jgi:tetratricopeptide (TPR) repeat protein
MALERMQRPNEAMVCYDQAVAADPHLTTAFLLKAGVLTRLKRRAEALQCYEQALRTQHRSQAA